MSFQTIDELTFLACNEVLCPKQGIQLPTWKNFNEVTGGLRPREFSIICGPTGTGKTTWLANLSRQLLMGAVPHFVASVETGHLDFIRRVLSTFGRRDFNDGGIGHGPALKEVFNKYSTIFKGKDLVLSLYENRISCEQMLADLERAHKDFGCKVAILDNLNFFLEITSAANERIEMDRTTHEFIMFCKRIDMHVIMVMHPKKTDGGRVESEFDIKGSSTAVQEAHNIFLFNRLTKDQIENGAGGRHTRELKFAKLRRRGKYTGASIRLENQESCYDESCLIVPT